MDYREKLLGKLKMYLECGSMPKMALEHLDEAYEAQFFANKKASTSKEQLVQINGELSKAYGDIIKEIKDLLVKYVEPAESPEADNF